MKIVFCGTPQFAVSTLEKLLVENFAVELVLTNPDEPSGRGYETRPSPVKRLAVNSGLQVFQPAKLRDSSTREFLSKFSPDAVVVAAYGHLLPSWMLAWPRKACINLHASLLPKLRGAAPIQWALIHGESTTGVTTMKMDEGLDTGDILLQRVAEIRNDDTTETLSERLARMGAELMVETLKKLERGEIAPQPQDHRAATLAPMLKKEDGQTDWSLRAEEIARRVRGLRPWPGAYTTFRGKNLHLWRALPSPSPAPQDALPGALLAESGRLLVVCGQATLLQVEEVQWEGRRKLPARDFLNGIRLAAGEKVS